MTIKILSTDPALFRLCQEIVLDISELGSGWNISLVRAEDNRQDADIEILDFHQNFSFEEATNKKSAWRLFLVDRNELQLFHERAPDAEANVLLKPVTRSTLSTFILAAVSHREARSLRADRDEVLQCLIQTNLRLQEYDHDRTTFLARAVHDFRAPLTALTGYCGLLLSESLGDLNETQREVLRRMHNSAKRLSRMAGGMFDLSVGRQIERRPDLHAGDIRECMSQALHEIGPFADEKSISITAEMEPCAEVYFDPGQIVQVLVNILDNACKFTPREGSIEIRGYPFFWERRAEQRRVPFPAERRGAANARPNSYRLDIADSGPAIPNEHMRGIFEEYTSYAGARDRSGGGLGLAICKMIISRHEGRISVENRDLGPVFSFVLPLRRHPEALNMASGAAGISQTIGAGIHAN